MKRVFHLKIIQPDFNKLYRKYEQMFADNQKKESGPVAIKVQGRLEGARIEHNISEGGGLLEADEIKNSSIRGNRTILPNQKGNIEKLEIIEGDKIEQHGEKNKASIKKNYGGVSKEWYQKWWGQIIIGLVVLIFGSVILKILNVI